MNTPHRTGPAAHRALAHDLVALLEHDMQYLGWFVAIARAYPESAATLDWAHAMDTARAARVPLQVAEALLTRSSHAPIGMGLQNHRSGPVPAGAISATGANASIPANARRAGSAKTGRNLTVAPVSRPRTCV